MASYEQQAEVLSRLSAFSDRNKTNFNKRDAVLHEIQRHRENKAASIKFRNNLLDSQKRANYKHEYERLMGIMTAGLVKDAPSKKFINQRMGRLKEFANESINGKEHQIFKPKKDEEKTDEEKLKDMNRKLARNRGGNRVTNTMIVTPQGASSTVYT